MLSGKGLNMVTYNCHLIKTLSKVHHQYDFRPGLIVLTCVKHIYGFDNQLPCQSCWPSEVIDPKSASAWLVSGVNVTPNGQSVTELFFHQPLIRSTRSCDARPLFASNAGIVWELLNCWWPMCKGVILYCICTMRRGDPRMLDSTECIEGIWKRTHFWCICMYAPCFCCHTDLLRNNIFSCSWTCQCRFIFFK